MLTLYTGCDDGTPEESDADSSAATDSDGDTETDPAEETHVVLDECGLELTCPAFKYILDPLPQDALDCPQATYDAMEAGLIRVEYELDGAPVGTYREELSLLLPDQTVLRQSRERANPNGEGPWSAWSAHEICQVSSEYEPEANVGDCLTVEDWTCEAVAQELAGEG